MTFELAGRLRCTCVFLEFGGFCFDFLAVKDLGFASRGYI